MGIHDIGTKIKVEFKNRMASVLKDNGFLIDIENVELWDAQEFENQTHEASSNLPNVLILSEDEYEPGMSEEQNVTSTLNVFLRYTRRDTDTKAITPHSQLKRGIMQKFREDVTMGICQVDDVQLQSYGDPVYDESNLIMEIPIVYEIQYTIDNDNL